MAQGKLYKPKEDDRKKVQAMVSFGITLENIAKIMEVTQKTLTKHFKNEIDTAHDRAVSAVAGKLYQKAMSGDNTCMIFYLKTRGKWREINRTELTDADGNNPMIGFAEALARATKDANK